MQAVLLQMVADGVKGSVINLASQAGRRGEALGGALLREQGRGDQLHAIGRAGDGAARHSRQRHLAGRGRYADVVACRLVVRQAEGLQPGEKKMAVGLAVPLGRMACRMTSPEPPCFLPAPRRPYITAQTLNVDGGNVMS